MARITRIGASTFPFIREIRGQSDLGFDARDAQIADASTEERSRTQKFSLRRGVASLRSFCVLLCLSADVF